MVVTTGAAVVVAGATVAVFAQVDAMHESPDGQALPHAPQFSELDNRS
jgi:hypothetical protein